jgi:predicted acylesterase/phospholipase RssA
MQVELALSGCSSKLSAHLGFLQALQDMNIGVSRLRASSGGALVAALWASGLPLSYLEVEFLRVDFAKFGAMGVQDYIRAMFSGYAAHHGSDNFRKMLDHYFGDRTLGSVSTPLEIMVSDMTAGELVILSTETHPEMLLSDAVYLSCSIPGHFRPHTLDGDNHIYRDGSIYKDFPIDLRGATEVHRVGHKVESPWEPTTETSPWTVVHELFLVLFRGIDANVDASVKAVEDESSVMCALTSVTGVSLLDFSIPPEKKEEMRLAGYRTGQAVSAALHLGAHAPLIGY